MQKKNNIYLFSYCLLLALLAMSCMLQPNQPPVVDPSLSPSPSLSITATGSPEPTGSPVPVTPGPSSHPIPSIYPEKLAFYYGWPGVVNNANGDTAFATQVFKNYDIVVFGNGLDALSHGDHDRTETIINALKPLGTRVYGYIDLCMKGGASCSGLSMDELKTRTDRWLAMGASGIFLDQAGYDYGVSRDRLNEIVDYIHSKDLSAFVNVWDPDDAFSPDINLDLNPQGTATHLGAKDYCLMESFGVTLSDYQELSFFLAKSQKGLKWKQLYGTKMATVNTIAATNPAFDEKQFAYVWWLTLLYGFDAMAWGETAYFSAETNSLPFHPRPDAPGIGTWPTDVTVQYNSYLLERRTTTGTIQVDIVEHVGKFQNGDLSHNAISYNNIYQNNLMPTDLWEGWTRFFNDHFELYAQSQKAPINGFRLFLDTDLNTATGFVHYGNPNLGSEYMVENGYLYRFTGKEQNDWSWTLAGTVKVIKDGLDPGTQLEIDILYEQINILPGKNLAALVEHINPEDFTSYDLMRRSPNVWIIGMTAGSQPIGVFDR